MIKQLHLEFKPEKGKDDKTVVKTLTNKISKMKTEFECFVSYESYDYPNDFWDINIFKSIKYIDVDNKVLYIPFVYTSVKLIYNYQLYELNYDINAATRTQEGEMKEF